MVPYHLVHDIKDVFSKYSLYVVWTASTAAADLDLGSTAAHGNCVLCESTKIKL